MNLHAKLDHSFPLALLAITGHIAIPIVIFALAITLPLGNVATIALIFGAALWYNCFAIYFASVGRRFI